MAVSSTTGSGGLDVESLVSQLMALEKRPLTVLDSKIATKSQNAGYLSTFKSKVTAFEASLAALRDSTRFAGKTATSSDTSLVTATTTAGAVVSDIDVKVVQTAQAERVAFAGFTSSSAVPGGGSFTLTVGSNQSLTVDLSGSTLTQIVDKINTAAISGNIPLKASLVQTAAGAWSLTVASTQTGAANTITASGPIGNATMSSPPIQAARDAIVYVDGLQVTSASNKISDVVPGVVLQLRKSVSTTLANATPVQVSVEKGTTDIHALANSVVTAFNALQDYYTSLTKTSATASERGPMSGDTNLASLMSQTKSLIASGMTDSSGGTFRFFDMGIEQTMDGKLQLNETNFSSAMTNGLADKLAAGVTIPLDTYLRTAVLSTGTLGLKEKANTEAQAALQKTRDALADRLSLVESSLKTRYSSLDANLYKLNNISTSLKSALDAMSNSNNK